MLVAEFCPSVCPFGRNFGLSAANPLVARLALSRRLHASSRWRIERPPGVNGFWDAYSLSVATPAQRHQQGFGAFKWADILPALILAKGTARFRGPCGI